MIQKFCQSCGMPLQSEADYGTNQDGNKNQDYCSYCWEKGEFTFHGSLEQMIEICIAPMVESNPGMPEEKAREIMQAFLPNLKRWQQA